MPVLAFATCAAFACALALQQAPAPQSQVEPRLRVEHFALISGPRDVVGAARLLRRDERGETQYELELEHFALASTLRLVETHGAANDASARHELVWREQIGTPERPAGRCVVARWTERGELETLQWGALDPLRRERALAARPLFPLELWELERGGARRHGERYDPLGDRVDAAWRTTRAHLPASALVVVREAADDEPLDVRRVYAGSALLAFRFGPAAPAAVAISEAHWNELRAQRHAQQASPDAAPAVPGSAPRAAARPRSRIRLRARFRRRFHPTITLGLWSTDRPPGSLSRFGFGHPRAARARLPRCPRNPLA